MFLGKIQFNLVLKLPLIAGVVFIFGWCQNLKSNSLNYAQVPKMTFYKVKLKKKHAIIYLACH